MPVAHLARHIPNGLTFLRILVAFAFPFLEKDWQSPAIIIAVLTEFFDGYLSRKYHWTTTVGQILDPIADKLFFFSVGVTWLISGTFHWVDLVLVGTRDIGVLLFSIPALLLHRLHFFRRSAPLFFGKVTTALQYVVLFSILVTGRLFSPLAIITALTGLVAVAQYVVRFRARDSIVKRQFFTQKTAEHRKHG